MPKISKIDEKCFLYVHIQIISFKYKHLLHADSLIKSHLITFQPVLKSVWNIEKIYFTLQLLQQISLHINFEQIFIFYSVLKHL